MNERFFTVEPMDFEGEPFTIEGLQATLDKVREQWGGKSRMKQNLSQALCLGDGAALLAVESGRVIVRRDAEASAQVKALAKARAVTEREPDGRVRTFYAKATIVRITGLNRGEATDSRDIEGEGLMGLLFNAAMYVQEILGDVPDCMSRETCEFREKGMRAQISRAIGQQRHSTCINFPGNKTAQFFELGCRPNEYYHLALQISGTPPEPPARPLNALDAPMPRRSLDEVLALRNGS